MMVASARRRQLRLCFFAPIKQKQVDGSQDGRPSKSVEHEVCDLRVSIRGWAFSEARTVPDL